MVVDDPIEQLLDDLKPMFLDDARERLERLQALAPVFGADGDPAARGQFQRELHSLKGAAGSFGFPLLGAICHRLEDYLSLVRQPDPRHSQNILKYVDTMDGIIQAGQEPAATAGATLVRSLPRPQELPPPISSFRRPPQHVTTGASRLIEALFIGPKDVQYLMLDQELGRRGIHSTPVASSFAGLEVATVTHPDLILVAKVIDLLSGLEVIQCLRAIQPTATTPTILVKSVIADVEARRRLRQALPHQVAVVRKGPHLAGDLDLALGALGLTRIMA